MQDLNDLTNDNFAVNIYHNFFDCDFVNYEQSNSLLVLHQNIRSLRQNFGLLVANLNALTRKPDLLFVSETWIFSSEVNEFHIPGYDFLHTSKETYRAGGVGVFAKNILHCRAISCSLDSAGGIKVSYSLGSKMFNFICFYKLHSCPSSQFITELETLLRRNQSSNLILLGDFNLDLLANCENTDNYCALLARYRFYSFLNEPTRPTSGSCLDHILGRFENAQNSYDCFNVDSSITDHCLTGLIFNCPIKHSNDSNTAAKNFTRTDYAKLNEFLRYENWENVYSMNDVSLAYANFINTLKNYIDLSQTTIRPKTNLIKKLKPWISDSLAKRIDLKNKLGRKLSKHPNNLSLKQRFKNLASDIKREIPKIKDEYYRSKFMNCSGDLKKQ